MNEDFLAEDIWCELFWPRTYYCKTCEAEGKKVFACYGYNVTLKGLQEGNIGDWYCAQHKRIKA